MFENKKLTVKCPHCGHEMIKNVHWIKMTSNYRCFKCNELVKPDKKSLLKELRKMEKAVGDLFNNYNKLGTVKL